MEPDDAGVQSQTGVEPGELREIDGRGGGESAATGLKGPATPCFCASVPVSAWAVVRTNPSSRTKKPALCTFELPAYLFPPTPPNFSHGLALVRHQPLLSASASGGKVPIASASTVAQQPPDDG